MNQALAPASAGQQQRALWLTTFAFTVCFAVWMIFGAAPALGFDQADGILLRAPSIFPSEHNTLTLLSLIPHLSAACFVVIYIIYLLCFLLYSDIGIISIALTE